MLIISTTKTPSTFKKIVLPYLYEERSGLYIGEVTRKILEYLLEIIPDHIGNGHCFLYWKDARSPKGFITYEIIGDGGTKAVEIDGITFYKREVSP